MLKVNVVPVVAACASKYAAPPASFANECPVFTVPVYPLDMDMMDAGAKLLLPMKAQMTSFSVLCRVRVDVVKAFATPVVAPPLFTSICHPLTELPPENA